MPGYCTQIVSITPNGQAYYDPSSYLPWIIPVRVRVRAGDTYSNGSTSIRTAEPSVPPKELGTPSNCTGNPINDSNGNKFETSKDTPQIGSGTLEFNRYYNSGPLTIKNELGWGWSHNYSTRIAVAYDYATVTLPDGKTVKYNLLSNEWKRELDNSNPLIELKDSSGARTGWRLLDVSEGILSVFSPSGVLLERRYSDGTFTVLDYNIHIEQGGDSNPGTLDSATDNFGRQLTLQHDANGVLNRVRYPSGKNDYLNVNGNLTGVTWNDGSQTIYHYGEPENAPLDWGKHLLTGSTSEDGRRFSTFRYDSSGRGIETGRQNGIGTYKISYDNSGTSYITDPLNVTRTHTYQSSVGARYRSTSSQPGAPGCDASSSSVLRDTRARVYRKVDFAGNTVCYGNDPNRRLALYQIEGLVAAEPCPASPAGYSPTVSQRKTSTEWHPLWDLKVREARPNKITTWVYHGRPDPTAGGAIASCAPSDAYVYDTVPIAVLCKQVEQATTDTTGGAGFSATASGAPRIWTYTWNRHGQMLTANGPRTDVADVTTYEYYPDTTANWTKGDLKTLTNALGQVWSFTQYDAAGRLLSMTDPNGVLTTQTWHPRGWLTSRTTAGATTSWSYYPTGLLQRHTRPDGRYDDYTWDDAHRLTDITDALGNRTHYTLDAAGNVTQVDVTDAGDQLARQQRTEYDLLGRPWKRRDSAGNVTEQRHDAMNRLNKLIDPKNRETDYQWDALGRLRQIDDAQQPVRGVTQAQYDGQDQLKSLTAPNGASTQFTVSGLGDTTQEISPDRGTLIYTHDAAGNVTQRTDGVGRVTGYTWDALNRPLTVSYRPSAGGAVSETVTYTWDASAGCSHGVGRLCAVSDGAGSTTYSYNDKGHLVSATRMEAGQTHVTQYVRDLSGQVLSWVDPTRFQFYSGRDEIGNMKWLHMTRAGQPVSTIATDLSYDATGTLTSSRMAAGQGTGSVGVSREFNEDGLLIDGRLASPGTLWSFEWTQAYARQGEAIEVQVTISPAEVRGVLMICKSPSMPCTPETKLGETRVDSGGTYTVRTSTDLPVGIYWAGMRFEPYPPFRARFETSMRPLFIGIPPSQLIDDLLP